MNSYLKALTRAIFSRPAGWVLLAAAVVLGIAGIAWWHGRPAQAPQTAREIVAPSWIFEADPKPPPVQFVSATGGEQDTGSTAPSANLQEVARWLHKIKPLKPMVELPTQKKFQRAKLVFDGQAPRVEEVDAFFERRNLERVHLFLDDVNLWPGSLLQGAGFRLGRLDPVSVPRSGITYIFKDILFRPTAASPGEAPETYARPVEKASAQSFNTQHAQFLGQITKEKRAVTPSDIEFEVIQAYSESDAEMKLKVSAKYLGASLDVEHRDRRQDRNAQVFIVFRQAYYTVAVDPPQSRDGGYSSVGFFADSVNLDDLKHYAGPDSMDRLKGTASNWEVDPLGDGNENPPVYVQSVTYGRMLIAAVSSQSSSRELEQALRASYNAGVGSFNLDVFRKKLEKAEVTEFKLRVRGGPAKQSSELTQLSGIVALTKINEWIKAGETITEDNMLKPIGFSVRQLADNTTAGLYLASKYSLIEDMPVTPTVRLKMKRIFIRDDHDGFGRGDGDWLFMGRVRGGTSEVFSFSGEYGDDTDFYPEGWFSGDVPVPGGKVEIHVRMGEEEHPRTWDAFPWDRGVEGVWSIDVSTLDFKTLDLGSPVSTYKLSDGDGNFIEMEAYFSLPADVLARLRKAAEQ